MTAILPECFRCIPVAGVTMGLKLYGNHLMCFGQFRQYPAERCRNSRAAAM